MKKATGWAIKLDGRILSSWVHSDESVLAYNAVNWPKDHIKIKIEVVPVDIVQVSRKVKAV